MDDGWEASAPAWIADMGELGDFGRRFVLDPVMLAQVSAVPTRRALDVGCGEGRFCRMLRGRGIDAVGLDPTRALLEQARRRDPAGAFVEGVAEALPFDDGAFDLVASYLSLIDMPDVRGAIGEMARVLAPGGRFLIAHLNAFNTAAAGGGWVRDAQGARQHFAIDNYSTERAVWVTWRGIRIINHHRPLSVYLQLCIDEGLMLTRFCEPAPTPDAPPQKAADYARAPWFCVMAWRKPDTADR